MYPLPTLLIGCTDDVLRDLRRELGNLSAAVEGEYLDVGACLNYILAHPPTKRLVIFFPKSTIDIEHLERLNESVAGQPILALIDPAGDPSLMIRAMRAGAAQVVRLPLQPEDFRAAMNRIAVQFGFEIAQCRVLSVIGSIEGSGCTSLSLNLAEEIGYLRKSPSLLAEGSVGFGRLATLLNITPRETLADLFSDHERVDVERARRAMSKVDENLNVMPGAYLGISPVQLSRESVERLLSIGRQVSDFIVMDGRYNFDELDLAFLDHSQQIVLVTQANLSSLYGVKRILEMRDQRQSLAQMYVVVNRYEPGSKEFSLKIISDVLEIPKLFVVRNDPTSFKAAELAGKPLRAAAPHSHALADINALARVLLGMPPEPTRSKWSFLLPWHSLAEVVTAED